MKTKQIFLISALVIAVLFSLNSCRKVAQITDTSDDNAVAESNSSDVMKVVESGAKESEMEGSNKQPLFAALYGSCATITVTPALPDSSFPKTMLIDFGTSGCLGDDGKTRKGTITVVMTDFYRNTGCEFSVQTNNYYVNDYQVDLSKTVKNEGFNSDSNLYFTIHADAVITTPDNETITWSSDRVRTWIEGASTSYATDGLNGVLDDVYLVNGTASGINRKGKAFTAKTTKDLRIELSCHYIVEGVIEITPDQMQSATIDFGNGSCDDQATVTIGSKVKTITLH